MNERKSEAVSGWYPQSITTPRELTDDEVKKVDEWFDRLIEGNYKRIQAEIPGKMMLALGKMAQDNGVPFSDFIEAILREYLEKQEVHWQDQ